MSASHASVLTPNKWLITGGCGFIGVNLVENLVSEGGHTIRIIDNLSVGTREDLARICNFEEIDPASLLTSHSSLVTSDSSPPNVYHSPVQLVVSDVLDEQLALRAVQGADVIVHLAAETGVAPSVDDPRQDCMVNIIGTLNYLEAARHNNIKRFVFASSGAPVGECEPPIHEEIAAHPVSPYGAGKLAGEGYCSAYFHSFGVDTVSLRFGNVYGPGSKRKTSVVAKFIMQAMNGETLEIYGDGNQTRDFIHVADLVRAIRSAVEVDGIGGETFQIATFRETTVNEIARLIKEVVEQETGKDVTIVNTDPRPGDVRRNYSDISKAKKMLGYEPHYDLPTGLRKTFQYFQSLT